MSSQLLFSIKDASVRYKEIPVFQDLSLNIHQGKRIALIGKNGAGKSTIMNIISGLKKLDDGEKWEEPGISVGYLGQEYEINNYCRKLNVEVFRGNRMSHMLSINSNKGKAFKALNPELI